MITERNKYLAILQCYSILLWLSIMQCTLECS